MKQKGGEPLARLLEFLAALARAGSHRTPKERRDAELYAWFLEFLAALARADSTKDYTPQRRLTYI